MARPPYSFHDLVGQKQAATHAQALVRGAKALGEPCPPLLVTGRHGLGKSTLAKAVAAEYGSQLTELSASDKLAIEQLAAALQALCFGDFLLVEEAHFLSDEIQENTLREAVETRLICMGGGKSISVADFTLVLATPYPGRVRAPLRGRLHELLLVPYSVAELKAIVHKIAGELGLTITAQAARKIAEIVPHTTPRRVRQLVGELRLLFPGQTQLGQAEVEHLFDSKGIDGLGLDPHQRLYLEILQRSDAGASSITHLKARLGLDEHFVREALEPLLFDLDLVTVGSNRSRELTPRGWAHNTDSSTASTPRDHDSQEVPTC